MHSKEQTLTRISQAFFQLEARKGHQKWSVADLARKSKVSRPLVYRYLGKSKEEITKNIILHFTEVFFGLDSLHSSSTPREFMGRIALARSSIQETPEAVPFYLKWRAAEGGWIREEFIRVEKEFQKKLKLIFNGISDGHALEIHAILHGLITSPFISSEDAAQTFRNVMRIFMAND